MKKYTLKQLRQAWAAGKKSQKRKPPHYDHIPNDRCGNFSKPVEWDKKYIIFQCSMCRQRSTFLISSLRHRYSLYYRIIDWLLP